MNIRTKLILAFLATSMISMGALGLMAYQGATEILQQVSQRQLRALAESKKRDLAKVIDGWKVRVQLISRRTELRRSLEAFSASHDEKQIAPIAGYIGDAVRAVEDVSRITVFDAHGHVVTMFGGSASVPPRATPPKDLRLEPALYNTFQRDDGVDVVFFTLLTLGDSIVGSMEVVLNAGELEDIAIDRTGLGERGETMILTKDAFGAAVSLTPLRHDATPHRRFPPEEQSAAIRAAFEDAPGPLDHVDYRGESVWSATRFLPEAQWGVVVKVDRAEEALFMIELQQRLSKAGIALSAFAIIGAICLGFYYSAPIRRLADLVQRVRQGETELRAPVRSEDEVGYLSRALNEFMDDVAARDEPPKPPLA